MFTLVEIALSVGVLATLITVVTACVCGCKNSNQKSELVGTAGVVKLRIDEEAPSPTPTTPASVKRASTQNSQRSLPEIPQPVGRHDSGDTTSEIYATVNLDQGNKTAAVASSSSREHPYEHAYAKLQNENHVTVDIPPEPRPNGDLPIDERDASQSGPESMVILASVAISGQVPSSQELPYITPPNHSEPVQHFSGDSTDSTKGYTSISVREPLSNIRAKSNKVAAQPHYATVSDDSDEMYAAIDDPSAAGSDTYAQIAPPTELRHSRDDKASLDREPVGRNSLMPTTSDVAARRSAPPEISSTSNASHSRQASSSSAPWLGGSPRDRRAPLPAPPAPPAAAPSAPSHSHTSTGDLHFSNEKVRRSLNEKHQRNHSCVSSSDFYGCNYPVEKHRFSSGDLIRPLVAKELNFDIDQKDGGDNLYNSIDGPGCSDYSTDANTSNNSDRAAESPSRNLDDMYAKVMKKTKGKEEPHRKSKESTNNDTEGRPFKFRGDDPGYETIDRKTSSNHGYETITHKERKLSQNQDPGYETVKELKTPYANNVNKMNHVNDSGPNSLISSSDPGYEHINKIDAGASDSDPNYEVLRNNPPTPPYATIAPNYKIQPTYSTVNKKPGKFDWSNSNEEGAIEPNYESMPHEPLYTTGSESDPNYESVRPKSDNYESVGAPEPNYESLRLNKDPRYESVRSKNSGKDPNYESVKYYELSQKEPPYEKVQHEGESSSGVERSDSNAGYERINVPHREPKSSINNGDVVSDYFQV